MNQWFDDIERASATLLAISPQTVKQSSFMADQHRLKFPLLSDPGNHVARQFGLVYRVPDDQQAVFRRSFINLPLANGDDTWELPVPATYMLERDGSVAYASVNADYMERPEPIDVVRQVTALKRDCQDAAG